MFSLEAAPGPTSLIKWHNNCIHIWILCEGSGKPGDDSSMPVAYVTFRAAKQPSKAEYGIRQQTKINSNTLLR